MVVDAHRIELAKNQSLSCDFLECLDFVRYRICANVRNARALFAQMVQKARGLHVPGGRQHAGEASLVEAVRAAPSLDSGAGQHQRNSSRQCQRRLFPRAGLAPLTHLLRVNERSLATPPPAPDHHRATLPDPAAKRAGANAQRGSGPIQWNPLCGGLYDQVAPPEKMDFLN
ncbi:TPA: hypothetical protein ACOD9U_000531 [Stenotrophomonas maltophilia]